MRSTKKSALHAVPATPEADKPLKPTHAPIKSYPRPQFGGTKPTREVSRALRNVMRDCTPDTRQPREATGFSHVQMFLWVLLVGALVVGSAMINRPRSADPASVKTYSLEKPQ